MADRIAFTSGGVTCVGYLHRSGDRAPRPCVVLCTGFGGTQDTPSIVANARAFEAAGYAAMTFDYRSFGESDGQPRQLVDIEGQLDDIGAAVACARRDGGVDADRIVLWGSSLGGGHVVTAAARDERIAAVIAQVPFNGFPKKVEGRSAAATMRLLWAMTTDSIRGALRLAPAYIPAVGRPGDLAVMASAEADAAIDGMASPTWRNSVAPRALFDMMRYRPGDSAPAVRCPVLVCIGERDKETAGVDTRALARRAPRGEVKEYPYGHFDFYRPGIREQITSDQVEFLDRVLARR